MTVRRLGDADRGLWERVARRCPYATYFHTWGWAELMATHHGATVAGQGFELGDGLPAVLPLLAFRVRGVFQAYESMVPGVYGGPIAERPLTANEVEAILDLAIGRSGAGLRVFGNPYLEAFLAPADVADEFTHVIDLREGFDSVFRRFHTNHRRTYRAAAQSGLVVERARTREDFRAYFGIYQLERQRWGMEAKTDDPFELFAEIHRRADPNVVLWLARLGERVVAGDLWLYWNQHNVGWHGAADPAFFHLHPTNFLITEILRDACARGDRWCDLNPSGGSPGVVAFKDSFGVERWYFRHSERRGGALLRSRQRLQRFLRVQRRRIARATRLE